jgi:hypothetical protein
MLLGVCDVFKRMLKYLFFDVAVERYFRWKHLFVSIYNDDDDCMLIYFFALLCNV